MSITFERSESYETYSTKAPVPVGGPKAFERLIAAKTIKQMTWNADNNLGWVNLVFSDLSTLTITNSLSGALLRFVPAPVRKN